MAGLVKIVVELHEGERTTSKIWRFDGGDIQSYTLTGVSSTIRELFPHICKKGFHLRMHHFDDLAGKVDVESDGDMREALENFATEWRTGGLGKEFLVLHVSDCIVPQQQVVEQVHEKSQKVIIKMQA